MGKGARKRRAREKAAARPAPPPPAPPPPRAVLPAPLDQLTNWNPLGALFQHWRERR